MLQTDFFYGA